MVQGIIAHLAVIAASIQDGTNEKYQSPILIIGYNR